MAYQWKHTVSPEEDGLSLEKLLQLQGYSKKEISRQKFLPQGITVDGKKCRTTEKMHTGNVIVLNFQERLISDCYVSHEQTKAPWKLLYEDQDILIADKPSGLPCHPGPGHYYDNLGSMVMAYCREKKEEFPIREIGRLDGDTSGIVVFAKNQPAAARLWKQREEGNLKKTYYALAHGLFTAKSGTIDHEIDGRSAVTYYRILKEAVITLSSDKCREGKEQAGKTDIFHRACEMSLAECTLRTGRTHQIRIHMSGMGHPLAGDRLYGKTDGFPRLCLHAGEIRLTSPFTKEEIHLRSPLPEIYNVFLPIHIFSSDY